MKIGTWTFAASGNGETSSNLHSRTLELVAFGTWGGGTLTLEYTVDGGTTWIALSGLSMTANGTTGDIRAASGTLFRPVLTGSTSPALTVILQEVA